MLPGTIWAERRSKPYSFRRGTCVTGSRSLASDGGGNSASAVTGALLVREYQLEPEGYTRSGMVRVPGQKPIFRGTSGSTSSKSPAGSSRSSSMLAATRRTSAGRSRSSGAAVTSRGSRPWLISDAHRPSGPLTSELGPIPRATLTSPSTERAGTRPPLPRRPPGRACPRVHHWRKAAALGIFATILQTSATSREGARPCRQLIGNCRPWGASDRPEREGMVLECVRRQALPPRWSLERSEATCSTRRTRKLPFDRSPPTASAASSTPLRSRTNSSPPSRAWPPGLQGYACRRMIPSGSTADFYSYVNTPLKAQIHSADDSSPSWRKAKMGYNAAYGIGSASHRTCSCRAPPPPLTRPSSISTSFFNAVFPDVKPGPGVAGL